MQQRDQGHFGSAVLVFACAMLSASSAGALDYVIEKVALQGDPAPLGGGAYQILYGPLSLNGPGDIGFAAGLSGGTASSGGFVVHPDGGVDAVLDTDTPPTLPGEAFEWVGPPCLNDSGEFAFAASLLGGPSDYGWFAKRASGLEMLARSDEPVPGLVDTFWYDGFYGRVCMLSNGDALLSAGLWRTNGEGSGVFIIGATGVDIVVTDEDPIPIAGSPTFAHVGREANANSSGDTVFYGVGVNAMNRGVFARAGGDLVALAVEGETAPFDPSRTYSFSGFTYPRINEAGQVAFAMSLDGGPTGQQGVFIAQANGTIEPVALTGDPVPGSPEHSFSAAAGETPIDDAGNVIFNGVFEPVGGEYLSGGIYHWNAGVLHSVIEKGFVAPDSGGAMITGFTAAWLVSNNAGVVVFAATLDDGRFGIYRAIPVSAPVPMLAPISLALLVTLMTTVIVRTLRRHSLAT